MVVLIIAWNIYPGKTGGIEVFNYHFLNWLNAQPDIETCLITSKQMAVLEVTPVKQYKIQRKLFGNIGRILYLFKAIISLSDNSKILFFSYSKSSWKIWFGYYIVASILRIPYFIYIHGGGMYSWKHKLLMRRVFRKAVEVFCVSHLQKQEYESRVDRNIEVLPPVMPFGNFNRDRSILPTSFGITKSSFVFLYLGSIRQIKGTDILIQAFTNLNLGDFAVANNIHLLLVGGGDTEKYEIQCRHSTCVDNVHFVGKVGNEVVGKYYSLADCFVLPSRVEGMPIALIEALHNKLPTIVSDLPTIPNLLVSGENCLKFPPEDYHALAEEMKYIFSDRKDRNKIAHKGHKVYIENWASNSTFLALLEAMRNAVE